MHDGDKKFFVLNFSSNKLKAYSLSLHVSFNKKFLVNKLAQFF